MTFLLRGGQYLAHLLGAGSQVELALQDQQPALTALLEDMERQVGDVTMAHWQVSGQTLELTKGVTGLAADEEQAAQLLHQALDQGFAQKFGQGEQNVTVDVDLPVTQMPPQEPDFDAVHQDVYTEPKDAALDGTTHEIVSESVGLDFDPAQLKAAYDADPVDGWARYHALCASGGSKLYAETLAAAGLELPYAPGVVERLARELAAQA